MVTSGYRPEEPPKDKTASDPIYLPAAITWDKKPYGNF